MGQEILYCYKCQTRLMGSEFEKGKAFKVGGQAACKDCVKDLLPATPNIGTESERGRRVATPRADVGSDSERGRRIATPRADVGSESERGRRIVSTPRIPAVPGPDSSSKNKTARATVQEKSRTTLLIGIVVAVLVLLAIVAVVMNSGSTARHVDPPPAPAPPTPPSGRTPDPAPAGFAGELRDLDEKMRAGLAAEDYRGVTALLDDARKRRGTPEWLSEIDLRIPQVLGRARRNSLPLRDKGIEAQKRNNAAEIKALKEKISAWGFPVLVEEFDKALADATTAPPPPPPSTPDPPAPPPVDPNAPPFIIYEDALGPWIQNRSWMTTLDFASTQKVHEGSKSLAVAMKHPWAGLYLHFDKALELTQYPSVSFWLCPNHDNPEIAVTLWGKANSGSAQFNLKKFGGLPKAGEWKHYVIPTADFHPVGDVVHAFVLQADKVTTDPLFFVDQIRFLPTAEDKTAPPPPADPTSGKWLQAALKAAARDYDGALKLVDDPADAELLKIAAQVPAEAGKVVDKWAKGQKVRFEYVGPAGDRVLVDGTVISGDALKVSIAREDGPLDITLSEFTPGTLADLFRGRPDRKPQDARGAAAFCALEGDVDGAKRAAGENAALPEKYLAFAQKRGGPSEAEAAARRLFWTAEAEFSSPRRRGAAIEKYTALLAGTDAARLRSYVTSRLEAAKDTVFLADDLTARGSFAPSGNAKIDVYWSSTADSAPSKAKENYVEAEFVALPGAVYRAWVWAGGCCQETFDGSWQGTELTTPNPKNAKEPLSCEPGSDLAPALKIPTSLRKWHAQHGGPKEPLKWEWIPLALPKYETPGPKRIRILTAQQGFSVAAIVVSATRREAPPAAEMKDLEKARLSSRKAGGNEPPGLILHEWWWGIEGNAVADLVKAPQFQGKPSGTALRDIFEAPRDMGDRYGARMRGFVHPPVTGNYVFWIASDDESELFLSTDESAPKKRSIASSPTGGIRDWTRAPSCKSAPVPLVAGRRNYIEALHKEGGGNDHLAVGWTLPDGSDERPIPGKRLSPWSDLVAPPTTAAASGLVFVKAFNLGGPPMVIDGRKWEGKGSTDLGSSPEFENQSVPLNPPTDDARAAMIRSSVFARGGTTVKVYNLPSGTYQIWLYVWEDNDPQTFDIFVQGKEVVKGYSSGAAGHWDRLGPYPAALVDGTLELHSGSTGDANFSGLEIWKAAGK